MSEDRCANSFSVYGKGDERFEIRKQGFLSIQEKKVFHISQNWRKFWMVLKQSLIIVGATPRVVLDAYSNEPAFLTSASPRQTFNLTGTVAPVAVCPQGLGHKQVRHVFSVCPPGSRFLFECDSQFGMENWVDELNLSLFPRNASADQILDDIQSSIKLSGSFRHRSKSNSMNDLSKIGPELIPELDSAPPLPPPNRKQHIPTSPTSPIPSGSDVISKYKVEVEVSTLPQVPKGVCVILVRKDDIQLCHAITMECLAQWLITHIREFKLTNENKLIITSGHRSFTGYGQIRLKGESCRSLYYKVKVFVQSKSNSKSPVRNSPSAPRAFVTLPDSSKPKFAHQPRSYENESDYNGFTSPPASPSIRSPLSPDRGKNLRIQSTKPPRPLPKIPQPQSPQPEREDQSYDRLQFPKQGNPFETPYSKLTQENTQIWSQGDILTGNYLASHTLQPKRTNNSPFSEVNKNYYHTQNMVGEYAVTNHGINQKNKHTNLNEGIKLLDSQTHSDLLVFSKDIRKDNEENEFSTSYSHPKSYEMAGDFGELRKSKSMASDNNRKQMKKMIFHPVSSSTSSPYEDATPPSSDSGSDTEVDELLEDNSAYVRTNALQGPSTQKDTISPYLVTQPELDPKYK